MPSFNLMFHVSSALAIAALIYWLLRLQAERRFQERLWTALVRPEQVVFIDWPERFVGRLCRAWQLPLEGEALQADPQRIDLQAWVHSHRALAFRSIRRGPTLQLTIRVSRPDTEGEWQARLEKSLGGRFTIQLET